MLFCLTSVRAFCYSLAHLLAKVAQLVEPQIVDLVVAGSCPVFRPSLTSLLRQRGFLFLNSPLAAALQSCRCVIVAGSRHSAGVAMLSGDGRILPCGYAL